MNTIATQHEKDLLDVYTDLTKQAQEVYLKIVKLQEDRLND